MQKTYLHVALPDPRVSATSSTLPSLCGNHLTPVWLDYDEGGTFAAITETLHLPPLYGDGRWYPS